MKKPLKISLVLLSYFVFAGLFFYGASFAQELISEPIEEPAFIEEEPTNYDPYSPENEPNAGGGGEDGLPTYFGSSKDISCGYNYKNWKNSAKFNSKPKWALYFMKRRPMGSEYTVINHENERFTDLNGDGLVDYLYNWSGSHPTLVRYESCVYLNNGSGFDKAFKCIIKKETTGHRYYGDCAA